MQKSTKLGIGIVCTLILTISVLSYATRHIEKNETTGPYTDGYGWMHGAKSSGILYQSDANLSRSFALIEYDKEKMAMMDSHTFISQVTPILNAYKDGQWYYSTIVFDDGTGVYFPDSDINEPATYGELNEKGQIITEYGVIYVSGTNITYKESNSSYTSYETKSLLEYIPDEYISDDFSAIIKDNSIYITFYAPLKEISDNGNLVIIIPDEEMSKLLVEGLYGALQNNGCEYLDSCKAVYIALANNGMGFTVTKDGKATFIENLGTKIVEMIQESADMI